MENKNAFGSNTPEIVRTPEADKVITVKLKDSITLDGDRYQAGLTLKVSVLQWRTLARHMEWVDGPEEHAPKKPKEKKSAAAAAAILLFLFVNLFALPATAAPPSTYGSLPLPPMIALLPTNGTTLATNGIMGAGTNSTGVTCAANQTNTWVAQTNSSGIPTNVITCSKFDELFIIATGGTSNNVAGGFTNTLAFWSGDGSLTNWGSNTPVFTLTLATPSGTNAVLTTNISRNILGSIGELVCGTIGNVTGANASQNLDLIVKVKPIRSGN